MKIKKILSCLGIVLLLSGCGQFQNTQPASNTDSAIPETSLSEMEIGPADPLKENINENYGDITSETIPDISAEDSLLTKDELTDGIYLIADDKFEPIPNLPQGIVFYRYIVDVDDSQWFSVNAGEQLAFKGNFSPNQQIYMERSKHSCYTFSHFVNFLDDTHLELISSEGKSALTADTIITDTETASILLKMDVDSSGEYYHYLDTLNWKYSGESHITVPGSIYGLNYLDGDFPKGYTAKFCGFKGTDYMEIEATANCLVIEMPDETFSDQQYHETFNLETTKEGYFILTIPENSPPGYYHLHTQSGLDFYDGYFCIN